MPKTVLVTRARGDESELTDALHDYGLNVIHEPLTEIFLLHTARIALQHLLDQNPSAVLITSRHGARALATLTPQRDLPLLCVGESTQQVALSLGFVRATATGQTLDDMIEYILSAYDEDAYFAYPSAEHVRSELDAALEPHGMRCERLVVYEAKAIEKLSDTLTEHIRQGHIDAVTFLSQRSAEIFMEHIRAAELQKPLRKMAACCMSEGIAAPLPEKAWKKRSIAKEPTLASLAACVDNALT